MLALTTVVLLLYPAGSSADIQFNLKPELSLTQQYEDNFRAADGRNSPENSTSIAAGIVASATSRRTSLEFDYFLTAVAYHEETASNTVRHRGRFLFNRSFSNTLWAEIGGSLVHSEESAEVERDGQTIRSSSAAYQRQQFNGTLSKRLGDLQVAAGYGYETLENDNPGLQDARQDSYFSSLAYQLTASDEIRLQYMVADDVFTRQDGIDPSAAFTGDDQQIRYSHFFSPRSTGFLEYHRAHRNFEGFTEDYSVHTLSGGYRYNLSAAQSYSLEVGYYRQTGESGGSRSGNSFSARANKRFGAVTTDIGVRTGWDEDYLASETRGFTRYWTLFGGADYRINQRYNVYASGSYRENTSASEADSQIGRVLLGVKMDWQDEYGARLEYSSSRWFSDTVSGYTNNRVLFSLYLKDSYLFRK